MSQQENNDLCNLDNELIDSISNDSNNEQINDDIKERYSYKHHISDYINLLKYKAIDLESNKNKYKSKYEKIKNTFILSALVMLLFIILCMHPCYSIPCILLIGIFINACRKSLLCCHYIFYIFLIIIVMSQLVLLITHVEI